MDVYLVRSARRRMRIMSTMTGTVIVIHVVIINQGLRSLIICLLPTSTCLGEK
jgi:hypothetical protein